MRLLLVDNSTVVRAALRSLLDREPDMEVMGEAEDGKLAVEMARELQPDVVIMDVASSGTERHRSGATDPRRVSQRARDRVVDV